ncbi:MAG: UDP-3-O-(3-hydroxymyristoyl)glucosamine N-acyltransferase [Sulfurovum sp.]
MAHLLSDIAKEIGVVFKGKDCDISGINTLLDASSSELSFIHAPKYKSQLADTKAKAVLIESKYAELLPPNTIAIVTDEPYLKLALASKLFAYPISSKTYTPSCGKNCDISSSASFGKDVVLGDRVVVFAGAYIGDSVTVGNDTIIYSNVSIYHDSKIGDESIFHSGSVIGGDGFGFAHTKTGEHIKIYQNGNVIVEDRVEIGANSTIDRAVFGTTYIREGTKIDNLVQVGHNCDIGANTIFAGQAGIAGSSIVGRNVIFGGQSATAGHLSIGAFSTIGGKAGVTKSLKGNQIYAGFPAIEHKSWLRLQAKISGLLKIKR